MLVRVAAIAVVSLAALQEQAEWPDSDSVSPRRLVSSPSFRCCPEEMGDFVSLWLRRFALERLGRGEDTLD